MPLRGFATGQGVLEVPPVRHRLVEREVDADVHAAIAEVPVRNAVEAVLGEQHVLLTQIRTEAIGRNRGVLPARERLARQRAGRESGAFLTDAPEHGLLARIGDDPAVERSRCHHSLVDGVGDLPLVGT